MSDSRRGATADLEVPAALPAAHGASGGNGSEIRLGFLAMCEPFTGTYEAQRLLEIARFLDMSRFDAFFYVDHFFLEGDRYLAEPRDITRPYQLECYTTLASVAAVTRRLRIGSLVTPLPLRHPSFVAKMGATIDVFSGGRLILGVGTGWNPREYAAFSHEYLGEPRARFGKFLEALEIVRALWATEGAVSYSGVHYRLEEAPLYPKPVQRPAPPIWLGGSSRRVLDTVARFGDGWSPAAPHYDAVTPEVYRRGWQEIRRKAVEYGRDPDAITRAVLVNTAIAESRSEALKLAEAQHLRNDWRDIPIARMEESGVLAVGTPSECAAHLWRYVEAGARYLIVSPVPMTMDAMERAARLYHDEVIPELRERAAREFR